jgi:hypothetical protein
MEAQSGMMRGADRGADVHIRRCEGWPDAAYKPAFTVLRYLAGACKDGVTVWKGRHQLMTHAKKTPRAVNHYPCRALSQC